MYQSIMSWRIYTTKTKHATNISLVENLEIVALEQKVYRNNNMSVSLNKCNTNLYTDGL